MFMHHEKHRAFTLVELMVTITIVAILATTVLFGMASVQTTAKTQRAKAQILRIHELLAERWETYETRRVDTLFPNPNYNWWDLAQAQLNAKRELIKLEMPDRRSDVLDIDIGNTVALTKWPPICRAYRNRVPSNANNWSPQHQAAECLYMILSYIPIDDESALSMFSEREIGDVDGDGMPEIIDPWGNPVTFIRWPAGFTGVSSFQDRNPANGHDAMDLASADFRDTDSILENDTYVVFPLILSAGPDGEYNVTVDLLDNANGNAPLQYRNTEQPPFNSDYPNDPYVMDQQGRQMGGIADPALKGHLDNIHNHQIGTSIK